MTFAILHSFVNIFADGYSSIKTFLFFVYLLTLIALYLFFRKKTIRTISWKYFGLSLATMYLYGLALEIFYSLANKIPLKYALMTGANGAISFSSIWHSHIAKAVIGIFFPHLKNIDAGRAYLGSFPDYVFLFGSILLLILLFEAFIYFITSFKKSLINKNKRQIIFLIFGYAVGSFSLIKTSVDGGILRPPFIISFIFIALFYLRNKIDFNKYYYFIIGFVALILLIIQIYLNHTHFGSDWTFIGITALFLLYCLIFYGSAKKINYLGLILFISLFFCSWWFASFRDRGIYSYSQFIAPGEKNTYFYNDKIEDVDILDKTAGRNIEQLAKHINRNLNYLPIAISDLTCKEELPFRPIAFKLNSDRPIAQNSLLGSNYYKVSNQASVSSDKQWKTEIILYRGSCFPENFSAINGMLIKNNITSYIYYNENNFIGL